jgi:hypothetical protein
MYLPEPYSIRQLGGGGVFFFHRLQDDYSIYYFLFNPFGLGQPDFRLLIPSEYYPKSRIAGDFVWCSANPHEGLVFRLAGVDISIESNYVSCNLTIIIGGGTPAGQYRLALSILADRTDLRCFANHSLSFSPFFTDILPGWCSYFGL